MSKVVLWPGFGWIGFGLVWLIRAVVAVIIILFGLSIILELDSNIHKRSLTEENLFKKIKKLNEDAGKLSIRESLKLFDQIAEIIHELRKPHIEMDPQAAVGYEYTVNFETFPKKWNDCYNYLIFDLKLSSKSYRDFDSAKIAEITQRVCAFLTK
jgi:hypothetical protein